MKPQIGFVAVAAVGSTLRQIDATRGRSGSQERWWARTSERTTEPRLILPEGDQPKGIDPDHQRHASEVAFAVMIGRAEPPAQLPAHPGQDQTEQNDADRIVDEEKEPIGQVKDADQLSRNTSG